MRTERFKLIVIGAVFLAVCITPLFYFTQSVYPEVFSKTLFFQIAVELTFFLWAALAWAEPRYRPRATSIRLALLTFTALLLLTAFTGIDLHRSFWSTQERMLGIFAFLHLLGLGCVMVSLKDEFPWRELFSVSLVASVVVTTIGFIQLRIPNLLLQGEHVGGRPGSTFGNPTFMAGYLLLHVFVAAWLYAERVSQKKAFSPAAWFFLAACLINIGGVLLSETRGTFLGIVAGTLLIIGYYVVRAGGTRLRLTAGVLLAGLLLVGGVFAATHSNLFWKNVPVLNRFQDISLDSVRPRIAALQAAANGFKERPLTGWGWDNFNVVFNKFYDPRVLEFSYQETRFDKPHDVFMEYLVAGGIVLFISYLALLFFVCRALWRLLRKGGDDARMGIYFGAALLAYLVHDAFLFDTLGQMVVMIICLAYIDHRSSLASTPVNHSAVRHGAARIAPLFVAGGFIASLLPIFLVNVPAFQATYYQYWGFQRIGDKPSLGIEYFEKAISFSQPYQWNMARDFAIAVTEGYFHHPDGVPQDAAERGIRQMEAVTAAHPMDAYNHYTLVDLYNYVYTIDPQRFLPAAEHEAAVALDLSPQRQEVYFSLAKTKSLEGDYQGSLTLLQQAIALNPKIPDAHFYYGIVAFADKRPDIGYKEITTAISLGRLWKNADELQVVASYFADSDHLDEAIGLYKQALVMNPDSIDAAVKLGFSYYFSDQIDLARETLMGVARHFDFSKSISYPSFKPILDQLGIPQGLPPGSAN